MEKHRLWPSKWEFHMKTLPCESAFQNIYLFIFQFPFASLASPCSAGSYMTITDCDSSLLCFFFTFWILFNSRSYFSGEGNVTWSSKQSPLRLEGVIITENSTVVWIFSDLQGFFAFPPPQKKKREWKAWYFSPSDIPLWTCIYLNIDSKAEHEISKPSYSEQQGSCEPLGVKPLVFFSAL